MENSPLKSKGSSERYTLQIDLFDHQRSSFGQTSVNTVRPVQTTALGFVDGNKLGTTSRKQTQPAIEVNEPIDIHIGSAKISTPLSQRHANLKHAGHIKLSENEPDQEDLPSHSMLRTTMALN